MYLAVPNTRLMMYKLQIEQDTDTCVKQMQKGNPLVHCIIVKYGISVQCRNCVI